jgi:Tol biopolymer transport system component/tRNA A-37 threonylcarbamoyl transferase component Bud32
VNRTPRFTNGARLGGYEILSLLGAGGMGEVYRARDEKLGRDVAIKVLSDSLAADAAYHARFEREARILASLNHPHIGAIYGSIESDGVRALVLEIVEGETLAELPPRPWSGGSSPGIKRLAVDDCLRMARQIAEALEAAHERGIVHRDLKPANIKVTPAWVVKVLDFGIARMAEPIDSDATHTPTVPAGPTQEGTAIGTAPYMSPEQARGLTVDARTDIWAFGCVLYELVAGRPAFGGDTATDSIAAVLTREPDWAALPPELPARIRELLRRCLKKDVRSRLQHIGDARIEIEETLAAVPGDTSSGTVAASRSASRRFAPGLLAAMIVAAVALPLGWLAGTYRTDSADPAFGRVVRLVSTAAHEWGPAISPDAKWIAYFSNARGKTDVWVKFIAGADAINLTAGAKFDVQSQGGIGGMDISPDGSQIAFAAQLPSQGASTWVIPAPTGGVPRQILGDGEQGMRWSPNGKQMVYVFGGGPLGDNIILADGDGQNPREIVKRADARHIHWLRWAPNGRFVYFNYGVGNGNTEGNEIFRASIPDGRLEPVVRTARRAIFPVPSPDGRGLFYSANPDSVDLGLWWRDLDSGRDVRVTTGVGEYAEASISKDRRLIVGTVLDVRQSLARVAVRFDQNVSLEPVTDGYTGDFDPAWFPDGSRMALSSSRTGQRNIWTTSAGSPPVPITTGSAIDERPVVSPDGSQIAFVSDRGGHRGIWTVSASGGAPKLASTVDVIDTISWAPDGKRLVYSTPRGDGPGLAILSLEDGRSTPLSTPHAATAPAWAPRGDVIAYVEPLGGTTGAFLKFVGADGRPLALGPAEDVRINNGVVAWSPDGRRLAVAAIIGNFRNSLSIVDLEGTPRVRHLTDLPDDVRPRGLTWNRDGASLTVGIMRASGDIFLAEQTR